MRKFFIKFFSSNSNFFKSTLSLKMKRKPFFLIFRALKLSYFLTLSRPPSLFIQLPLVFLLSSVLFKISHIITSRSVIYFPLTISLYYDFLGKLYNERQRGKLSLIKNKPLKEKWMKNFLKKRWIYYCKLAAYREYYRFLKNFPSIKMSKIILRNTKIGFKGEKKNIKVQ